MTVLDETVTCAFDGATLIFETVENLIEDLMTDVASKEDNPLAYQSHFVARWPAIAKALRALPTTVHDILMLRGRVLQEAEALQQFGREPVSPDEFPNLRQMGIPKLEVEQSSTGEFISSEFDLDELAPLDVCKKPIKHADFVRAGAMSKGKAIDLRNRLLKHGLVQRVGKRKGIVLTDKGRAVNAAYKTNNRT